MGIDTEAAQMFDHQRRPRQLLPHGEVVQDMVS